MISYQEISEKIQGSFRKNPPTSAGIEAEIAKFEENFGTDFETDHDQLNTTLSRDRALQRDDTRRDGIIRGLIVAVEMLPKQLGDPDVQALTIVMTVNAMFAAPEEEQEIGSAPQEKQRGPFTPQNAQTLAITLGSFFEKRRTELNRAIESIYSPKEREGKVEEKQAKNKRLQELAYTLDGVTARVLKEELQDDHDEAIALYEELAEFLELVKLALEEG